LRVHFYLFLPVQKKHAAALKKGQSGMGGGKPKHGSMAVRDLEQSQLSTASNNEDIASNRAIQIVWAW
jgi:hypothetical protein